MSKRQPAGCRPLERVVHSSKVCDVSSTWRPMKCGILIMYLEHCDVDVGPGHDETVRRAWRRPQCPSRGHVQVVDCSYSEQRSPSSGVEVPHSWGSGCEGELALGVEGGHLTERPTKKARKSHNDAHEQWKHCER